MIYLTTLSFKVVAMKKDTIIDYYLLLTFSEGLRALTMIIRRPSREPGGTVLVEFDDVFEESEVLDPIDPTLAVLPTDVTLDDKSFGLLSRCL